MLANVEQFAIVLAGAMMLAIEANRQFSRPAEEIGHHRYSILRGVEPSSLSTPAEHRRGWFFYICCYLVIYSLLLVSNRLRGLLSETAAGQKIAGATDLSIGDDASSALLGADNFAMPIYLSAAIIALLSTGVAAQAEKLIRAVAYRLAGIPRGIYRLITRLSRIDYDAIIGDTCSALVQTYDGKITGYTETPLLTKIVTETREALNVIDLLSPAVVGDYGTRFWPRENVHKLDELIAKQNTDFERMKDHLEKLDSTSEAIEIFHLSVLDIRNNIQALFAVLYIRNQNAYLPSDHHATAQIIFRLRETGGMAPLTHRIANALVITALLYLISYFFIDIWFQFHAANLDAADADRIPFLSMIALEARYAALEAILGTISFVVFFGVAAGLAAMVRETGIESNSWKPWRFGELPMVRFLLAAIWPVLFAGLALVLWKFCSELGRAAFVSGQMPTSQQVAAIVRSMFPFCFYPFLFSLVIVIYLFVAADKHNCLAAWKTISIAIFMALVYFALCAFAVISTYGLVGIPEAIQYAYATKEIALHALPALIFFAVLGALLELSEVLDET